MNRSPPMTEVDIQEAEADLDIIAEPPTKEEIVAAIESLKNGKAPGQDNLNAELLKADRELAAKLLLPLFTAIWEERRTADDWSEGIIVRIPKKGNLSNCSNWRGITLLSNPSKILAKIIIQSISSAVDQRNSLALGKEGDALAKYLPHVTSLSNVQSGRDNSTSTLWILREPLVASTETASGEHCECMESHNR